MAGGLRIETLPMRNAKRRLVAGLFSVMILLFLSVSSPSNATGQDVVSVDASKVLRRMGPRQIGINVNYLLDDDANRDPSYSIEKTILNLGVKTLRYPGGAKSDVTLWSTGDFTSPRPTLARTGPEEWPSNDARVYDLAKNAWKTHPMDFDAFMRLCKATGSVPVVVLAYDSMYRPATKGAVIPDRKLLLENAVSLVRYANV